MELGYSGEIAVLCAAEKSHYYEISGLDIYDRKRDARSFVGSTPVICHAPCAQWSKMRLFAKFNASDKELAWFCFKKWFLNGGIFEHPEGSWFFKEVEHLLPPGVRKYKVDQSDFGFPARKSTILYFNKCMVWNYPLPFEVRSLKGVEDMRSDGERELTTLAFDRWLVDCIRQTWCA